MRQKRLLAGILFAVAALVAVPAVTVLGEDDGPGGDSPVDAQAALGDAISYQGRLTDDGDPANGIYDLRFTLYNEIIGGSQRGNIVVKENVQVEDGLFTALLEFGPGAFDGEGRWLEIAVRPGSESGDANFTTLSPRQIITGTPYALFAKSAASFELPFAGSDGNPTSFTITNTAGGDAIVGQTGMGSAITGTTNAAGGVGVEGTGTLSDAIGGKFTGDPAVQINGGIQVSGNNRPAFRMIADIDGAGLNVCDSENGLVIDHPFANGDPAAFIFVTSAGGPEALSVQYERTNCPADRWVIVRGGGTWTGGELVNVLIVNDDTTQ